MNTKKFTLVLVVVVLTLVSAVAVSAAGVIPDDCIGIDGLPGGPGSSAVLDGNTFCFMGKVDDDVLPGWTTWTYGVRRDVTSPGNALSHITFDICVDDSSAVMPSDGETYETLAGYNGFVGRAGVMYDVEVTGDPDPTTLVGGIKFQDPVFPSAPYQQEAGEVHIFQFTQPTQSNPGMALRLIGFKDGNLGEPIYLAGPICDGSNAVELTSFSAQSVSLLSRILMWLGLR
jgi:hypothetical protein